MLHEAKLAKMEAEMKMVFQQKVQEKEAKLKQSEEELYARHREMKESLEKQRLDLEEKKRKIENGRPLTPEKGTVRYNPVSFMRRRVTPMVSAAENKEGLPPSLKRWAGVILSSARKVHCHPCNPFHGVSIAICATLSSSSILHLSLSTLSIVSWLLCSWHPSHSFARISTACFATASFRMSTSSCSRFRRAPVALSFRTATGFLFSDSDDNFMIPLRACVRSYLLCEM